MKSVILMLLQILTVVATPITALVTFRKNIKDHTKREIHIFYGALIFITAIGTLTALITWGMRSDSQAETESLRKELAESRHESSELRKSLNTPKAILEATYGNELHMSVNYTKLKLVDGKIKFKFSMNNISSVDALNGHIWIRICSACKYSKEIPNWETDTLKDTDRVIRFPLIAAKTAWWPGSEIEITPPVGAKRIQVDFKYACQTCVQDTPMQDTWIDIE